MKLCPAYLKIFEKIKRSLKQNMPVSVIGMYDSGKSFLFGNFNQGVVGKEPKVIKIDLSGAYSDEVKTLEAVNLGFGISTKEWEKVFNLDELRVAIANLARHEKVLLVFNIGLLETINNNLVLLLYNLRNLLGYQINWVTFANYSFLRTQDSKNRDIFEKIFFSEIVVIEPLDGKNSLFVLKNMLPPTEKIPHKIADKIIQLSSGNVGLMRSLLQAFLDKKEIAGWENEPTVLSRARKILSELDRKEITVLLKRKGNTATFERLLNFGYLTPQKNIFSPLLEKILKEKSVTIVRESDLTTHQFSIWSLLKENTNQLVTRDAVAKSIWGEGWEEKYSDWAIDQAIHSLRQRLIELGVKSEIVTKKGRGFVLEI